MVLGDDKWSWWMMETLSSIHENACLFSTYMEERDSLIYHHHHHRHPPSPSITIIYTVHRVDRVYNVSIRVHRVHRVYRWWWWVMMDDDGWGRLSPLYKRRSVSPLDIQERETPSSIIIAHRHPSPSSVEYIEDIECVSMRRVHRVYGVYRWWWWVMMDDDDR